MLGCNIRPFPAGWETVSKAAGAASTQLDAEQPPAYLLETPDQKASVPVRRQSQRQTAENQPQRLSKADKQRFCLRNLELCKIAKELEPDWHFLELTLAEQEIVRFLLAERQQVNNAATAPPISDCRSDKSSKSGSDVTERTGASEREARQWQRRYQHYFPYLEFSTETMTRLVQMPEQKRLHFESEFSRMNGGNLEDKHHVPRSEPKLFVREAGRDGRIYYRRHGSIRTVLIRLVGDQQTKIADYRDMQQ